jgi:hypothetical protein
MSREGMVARVMSEKKKIPVECSGQQCQSHREAEYERECGMKGASQ